MSEQKATVLLAGAVRDAEGVDARPGAVLVECGKVVAAGPPESLPADAVASARRIDLPGKLLLPAMVNAHTHLELTDLGPQPYDPAGGFVGWVKMLRGIRVSPRQTDSLDESGAPGCHTWATIHALHSGIQAVGDIASSQSYAMSLTDCPLDGVFYLEMFGIGSPLDGAALAAIEQVEVGLQPHAPYSAGPALFYAASRTGRPVSTHLAETLEEAEFIASGTGPWLDYLQQIGKWDDRFAQHYGHSLSPVRWMRPYLEHAAADGGWLVAHCNYVSDEDIQILADTNTSVAYCPIASEYFGHTGHRYRDMLEAGVNVCLGTDSIVCARPDDPQPLGLLSAMRRLYERDAADPDTLLRMATVNGARALRMPGTNATLQPGAPAKFALIDIDPDNEEDALWQAMMNSNPIEPFDIP